VTPNVGGIIDWLLLLSLLGPWLAHSIIQFALFVFLVSFVDMVPIDTIEDDSSSGGRYNSFQSKSRVAFCRL